MMNRRYSVSLFVAGAVALGALACSTSRDSAPNAGVPVETPATGGEPGAVSAPVPPAGKGPTSHGGDTLDRGASLAIVPREFSCDPLAVTADTPLPLAHSTAPVVLRPSGAPCANRLVYKPTSGGEHELSTTPGMIALADVQAVGPSLVACLSNERHVAIAGEGPLERISDGVQLECAVRTGAWSTTLAVVAPNQQYAAWIVAIEPDPNANDKLAVRWLRDSTFQFLHTETEGRPSTDGIYRTQLTITNGGLVVGATTKLDVPMFETTATATSDARRAVTALSLAGARELRLSVFRGRQWCPDARDSCDARIPCILHGSDECDGAGQPRGSKRHAEEDDGLVNQTQKQQRDATLAAERLRSCEPDPDQPEGQHGAEAPGRRGSNELGSRDCERGPNAAQHRRPAGGRRTARRCEAGVSSDCRAREIDHDADHGCHRGEQRERDEAQREGASVAEALREAMIDGGARDPTQHQDEHRGDGSESEQSRERHEGVDPDAHRAPPRERTSGLRRFRDAGPAAAREGKRCDQRAERNLHRNRRSKEEHQGCARDDAERGVTLAEPHEEVASSRHPQDGVAVGVGAPYATRPRVHGRRDDERPGELREVDGGDRHRTPARLDRLGGEGCHGGAHGPSALMKSSAQ